LGAQCKASAATSSWAGEFIFLIVNAADEDYPYNECCNRFLLNINYKGTTDEGYWGERLFYATVGNINVQSVQPWLCT